MDRDEYLARMRWCPPFRHFGIEPVWRPGERDIEGFVHDEVVRQYHDPRVRDDGGDRVRWMEMAWDFAMLHREHPPSIDDVLILGNYVEPKMNATGFRTVEVYIGKSRGAPAETLGELVALLCARSSAVAPLLRRGANSAHPMEFRAQWDFYQSSRVAGQVAPLIERVETADDWYLAYEAIHPFADGNGRTGKILHNWLLRTLDQPELVADYFGGGNP